jgi:hypothetical protein
MMSRVRLFAVTVGVLICLASVLVFAQDATPQPAAPALPASMEKALVPCEAGVDKPCDFIATKGEDIVGVWIQYLGSPRFNAPGGIAYIRYNADGTYNIGDSVENTAKPSKGYPSGTYTFDNGEFIIGPAVGAPPPCDIAPHYQLRILKYGDKPVGLRYVPISEGCPTRMEDLSQALVWVAPG